MTGRLYSLSADIRKEFDDTGYDLDSMDFNMFRQNETALIKDGVSVMP